MHVHPFSLIFNTLLSRCSCLPFHITAPPLTLLSPPSPSSHLHMAGTTATVVCSMCGDVGFPEKLFRCGRCRHRFQHSYCTNYYGDGAPASAGSDVCDWCLSDVAGNARWSSSSVAAAAGKQHAACGSQETSPTTSSGIGRKAKASGGDQETGRRATRPAGRRYKLLKDVLC